jgi:hypothetical protein
MSNRRTVAMVVNDNAGHLVARGALRFIASMLAPTGDRGHGCNQVGFKAALLLLLLLIFLPPREASFRFCAVGKPAWMPV